MLKLREKSGNLKKSSLCKVKIFKFYNCSDVATGGFFCHMLKIPADLILLKVEYLLGGVLVCCMFCFFSFSHSEVDILLQTQCLSLNVDANIYSVQLDAKTELNNHCPRAQVEVCMHSPISYSYECIKNNTMTLARDIIRVFYLTIMAVCSTVYIHLYWGSQKQSP